MVGGWVLGYLVLGYLVLGCLVPGYLVPYYLGIVILALLFQRPKHCAPLRSTLYARRSTLHSPLSLPNPTLCPKHSHRLSFLFFCFFFSF